MTTATPTGPKNSLRDVAGLRRDHSSIGNQSQAVDASMGSVGGDSTLPQSTGSHLDSRIGAASEESALKRAQQVCWGIIQKISEANDLDEMCRQFTNYFCRVLAVDQVAILIRKKNDQFHTNSISGVDTVDRSSPSIVDLEKLCEAESNGIQFWSHRTQEFDDDSSSKILGQYAGGNGFQSAVLVPLEFQQRKKTSGKSSSSSKSTRTLIGYVAIFADSPRMNRKYLELIHREFVPTFSRQLHVTQSLQKKGIARFTQKAARQLLFTRNKIILLMMCLAAAAMGIPTPYKVQCDVQLEPKTRRFIAAPMEGRLKKSFVSSGDTVHKSQILAVLDDDEINLKLKSARAELAREQERHDGALQQGEISEAQIAALEIKKLQHDIALFEQQMLKLEIRSPVDGIIVSGDLENVEGAPLDIGETLFEVGPIDHLDVEIMVPQHQIRFVEEGQDVDIRFPSFPLESFTGKIKKVYPRTEVWEEQAVFIAKVEVENRNGMLKPGMRGSAKIDTGPSVLGWNLFHRPIDATRSWLGF